MWNVSLIKKFWNYLIRILLQKQNSKNNTLTIREYRYLGNLLQNGISLNDALDIIKTKNNQNIIMNIHNALFNGENIENILFVDRKYTNIFKTFNHLYSLDKAILMVVDINEKYDEEIKGILSKSIYPFIIILVSLAVMYFGCFELIPNMINMFESMGISNDNILLYVSQGLVVILCLILVILILMIVAVYIIIKENMMIKLYDKIDYIFARKLISSIITYLFLSQYIIFIEKSMTTKEIIDVLTYKQDKTINYELAKMMEVKHKEGMSLVDVFGTICYFDERAKQLIKIGYITNSLSTYIRIYISEMNLKIEKSIKHLLMFFQGFSYLSVCVCVITIATLLFEPLSILESI